MDFSLTQLIVVPSTNTVPTTGYPYNLAVGQVGVFKSDYAAATASNVVNEPYIYIAQGRDVNGPLTSDRSDKIGKSKLISYTKVTGFAEVANEIWEVSDFTIDCGQTVSLTINAHSFALDTAFFNGLTRSVTVQAPCCDCGSDPCTNVDNDKIIDLLITQLQTDPSPDRAAVNLNQYFTFEKIGTGADAVLRITGKALSAGVQGSDLALNPYQFDRLSFRVWATVGTDTTADFEVYDRCEPVATVALKQRSTYPRLTSEEVKSIEKDYYSYHVPNFQQLFRLEGYNPYFKSLVEDGQVYDEYQIKFGEYNPSQYNWDPAIAMDGTVRLLIPNSITDIQAILAAYLGSPVDETGSTSTTSTTTAYSTSTTSTTTFLAP